MKQSKFKIYWELFSSFFKIGLFTFGGGYAMLPLIEETCVEKKKWITSDDMMNITVIAESTPGPVALNCSTFVGYKQAKIKGAIAGTVGVVLPSFIIIFIISLFLDNFLEIPFIASAFKGIKIGVGLLIAKVGIGMIKKMGEGIKAKIYLLCTFLAMMIIDIFSINFSSILLCLIAALVNLILYFTVDKAKGGAEK